MSLRRWNEPKELLNSLCAAIHGGTHGLTHNLSLDLSDTGIVVWGTSRSYYGAQLTIHVAKQFAEKQPDKTAIQLLLTVDEHPLRLTVSRPSDDDASESASTDDASVAQG